MESSDPPTPDTSISPTDAPNRRKSGRVKHKPVPLQEDPNISMSTDGSGKRKRLTAEQGLDTQGGESDEESRVDENDGDPDEEELKEKRKKSGTRKAPAKRAAKKPKTGHAKTTTLPVRPAVNGVKKATKPRKPRARPNGLIADGGTGLYCR